MSKVNNTVTKRDTNRGGSYFISVIAVIVCVLFTAAVTRDGLDENLFRLFDLVTFLFFPVILIPMLVSAGLGKDFLNAFRLALGKGEKSKSLEELKRARESVCLAIHSIIACGILTFGLSVVYIMYTCTKPEIIAVNMGVGILSIIYAAVFVLFLFPIRSRLEIKIMEYMQE